MGTWGIRNFENDGAADFVYNVYDNGKKVIKKSFLKIINPKDDDNLDASDCEEALAAAEIIAAAKGNPSEDLPKEMNDWLIKNDVLTFNKPLFSKKIDIVNLAELSVKKIIINSELRELWEETGDDFDTWNTIQADLITRLK